MSDLSPTIIQEKLESRFPGKIESIETPYEFLTITVALESIKEVIEFLCNDDGLNFKFLTTCCGMHFPDGDKKFGMVYHLHNLESNFKLRLKTFTNHEPPTFPSLTGLFKAANWMERETYDFFGFKFTDHPDLRRILNMDDMVGWPLRKEFPLEDQFRKDKDDKMFGR